MLQGHRSAQFPSLAMSASSQAQLDSITRQLCPPTSDAPGYENVVVGLSAHDGSILFTPHEGDSTFAKAFKAARPASAIKARTPVLSAILADTYVYPVHGPVLI